MHLTLERYLLALRGELPMETMARQTRAHLLQVCEHCRAGGGDGDAGGGEVRELPEDPRHVTLADVEAQRRLLSRMRAVAREARRDLVKLLRLPREEWPRRVANARTRFRSRAVAQLFIEEAKRRVRQDPHLAADLVALVPVVLGWAAGQPEHYWAPPLLARAAAQRANALRVAGDLPAAARLFGELRARPLLDRAAEAEVRSLEASLCIDDRRFAEAEGLLSAAAESYRAAGDVAGFARTQIKLANLLQTLGRPAETVSRLERAAAALDATAERYLFTCTVTGRVNALCDLDRADEAEALLTDHLDLYESEEDLYTSAILVSLRGRIAAGLGRYADAVACFIEARDRLLALDRDYDAILASLDLAAVHLAAGQLAELRELAAQLVPLFRSRGVARETLAALGLLAQAVRAESVTTAVLDQIRRRLEEHTGAPPAIAEPS